MEIIRSVNFEFIDITTENNDIIFSIKECSMKIGKKIYRSSKSFEIVYNQDLEIVNSSDVVNFFNESDKGDYKFYNLHTLSRKKKFDEKLLLYASYLVSAEINPPNRKARKALTKKQAEEMFNNLHRLNLETAIDISLDTKDKRAFNKFVKQLFKLNEANEKDVDV